MSVGNSPSADPELVAHERTYKVFNILLRWCVIHLASVIVGLTVWFATPAGFLGGLFTGVAVFVLGYVFVVRHEEHQPLDPWAMGR